MPRAPERSAAPKVVRFEWSPELGEGLEHVWTMPRKDMKPGWWLSPLKNMISSGMMDFIEFPKIRKIYGMETGNQATDTMVTRKLSFFPQVTLSSV